jgi:pimeloyl-ACP methyl ester carboxylesterase
MFRWDATGALRNVNVPILLLAGDLDIVTKLSASKELASQAPKASLQVIEGVNHMGMLEQSDRYNSAVDQFAERALGQANAPLGVQ